MAELIKEFVTLGGTQLSLDENGKPLEPVHETKPRERVYKPRHKRLTRERFVEELTGRYKPVTLGPKGLSEKTKTFLQELRG